MPELIDHNNRVALDALPIGTVVLETFGADWEAGTLPMVYRKSYCGHGPHWQYIGDEGEYDSGTFDAPVLVLWKPRAGDLDGH